MMAPILLWLFSEALGWFGAALIGYSIIVVYTQPWPPIEAVAQFGSSLLTVLGTLVTVGAIYLPGASARPPWTHSRKVVAPVVITACVVALYFLIRLRHLPPVLVSGFGLLAISGGLKRLLPYPEEHT